ncbi:uncharacterized protein BDV14DRAFT_166158 [Aspergillus stella-maris]|uniref:uncharacterized protein n=1 Tax=Aspergillus stella-maris TaxID=1810926 RepID=UPI003CCC9BD2
MPSHNSRSNQPSRLHLSEIINLYPDEEPYCAGYAPSQGRRCHSRTNARGRKAAMSLLNKGTKDLYANRDIEDLLYELAPNVLCTRYHQSQDTSLVGKWLRKIDRFLDTYDDSPPTPIRSAPKPHQRMSAQPPRTQNIPMQTRNRAHNEGPTLWSTFASLQDLEALAERYPAFASLAATSRNSGSFGSHSSSNPLSSDRHDREAAITPVRAITSANSQSQLSSRRSSQESSSDSTSSRSASVRSSTSPRLIRQAAFTETENTSREASDVWTSTTVRTSTRTREATGPRTRIRESAGASSTLSRNATRRPIEGDCSICLESLHRSHGSDDDSDDTDSTDEDNEEEEEQEVAWCKTQCGNNYHKNCIEQWLGTAVKSTCPTCRKPWRN